MARWTGEVVRVKATVARNPYTGQVLTSYEDGNEDREDNGILWMREGLTGAGEPEFGQVSIYRQRACMRRRQCQVCGQKITTPVIRWLLRPDQIVRVGEDTVTTSPPTCDACIPLSISECPVMSKERVIARVLEYELWGVSGLIVRYDPETGKAQQSKRALIAYGREKYPFDLTAVIAKQQAVRWTKWVME